MFFANFAPQNLSDYSVPRCYENTFIVLDGDDHLAHTPAEICVLAVNRQKKTITIRCPLGNPVPLFYRWFEDNSLVVADNFSALLQPENASGIKSTAASFDPVGIIESFIFDMPLSARTLYSQIKKLRGGEEITFFLHTRRISRRWYWLPKIQTGRVSEPLEIVEQAKNHINSLMDGVALKKDTEVLLPLTGGLDSRLFATLSVRRRQLKPFSYTFRRGWSVETHYAAKVAAKLSIPHMVLDLDSKCYSDFARTTVRNTGGMVTGMHTHGIYCCDQLLPKQYRGLPRIFGHYGGPMAGENTASQEFASATNTPESLLAHFMRSLFLDAAKSMQDEIRSDIEEIHSAFLESGSNPNCFFDFWRIMERQSALLAHLFSYHRTYHGVEVVLPYINRPALDFFFNLTWESRYDRQLFKQTCNDLYPDIFSLPTMHFAENSLMAKVEKLSEVVETAVNRIFPRQEFLLNPFRYEQHEKNLLNFLLVDINQGIEVACALFNCKMRPAAFPVWRHSSIPEYYRLAALSYLAC